MLAIRKAARKGLIPTAIILAITICVFVVAYIQGAEKNRHQTQLAVQTMESSFDRVNNMMHTINFNIGKIKSLSEFSKYQEDNTTDYYNLSMLCRNMARAQFNLLNQNARIGFYTVGTSRVVFSSETFSHSYFFNQYGILDDEVRNLKESIYFFEGERLVIIRPDSYSAKLYWIVEADIDYLFHDIMDNTYNWEFYDKNGQIIYSHISPQSQPKREQYLHNYYMGNYYLYYIPNISNKPLYIKAFAVCVIGAALTMGICKAFKRYQYNPIAKALQIPLAKVGFEDILQHIEYIRYENQALEEQFSIIKSSYSEDTLKDYFRGIKTYNDIDQEIIEELSEQKVCLVHIDLEYDPQGAKNSWNNVYIFLKKNICKNVLLMSSESLLLLLTTQEYEQYYVILQAYSQDLPHTEHIQMKFRLMSTESTLKELEGIYYHTADIALEADGVQEDAPDEEACERMLAFIHENYQKDISLDDLATYMGRTYKYASTAFKQATGVNFKDYLTQYRMEKARVLLQETDIKIKNLAEKVGYNSSNSFIRVFRSYYGVSPLNYKRYQH